MGLFALRHYVKFALILGIDGATIASPLLAQQVPLASFPSTKSFKAPGVNPAYHCADPFGDIFQIDHMNFNPATPRVGLYQDIRFTGRFVANTGDVPWLNITGIINGRPELEPLYDSPLCDIDVFQDMKLPIPGSDSETYLGMHRSCPPSIQKGYAEINAPTMPLIPYMVPAGKWEVRAEAKTQDGKRIFCVEGIVDVAPYRRDHDVDG